MPFHLQPAGPVQGYETFNVAAPLTTHWRSASCAEMCEDADDTRRQLPWLMPDEAHRDLVIRQFYLGEYTPLDEFEREVLAEGAVLIDPNEAERQRLAKAIADAGITAEARQAVRNCLAQADGRDCGAHRNGWFTTTMVGDELDFLRKVCRGEIDGQRRQCVEIPQDHGFVRLAFEPGQTCFGVSRHQLPLERPELYVRRGGDWRAHLGVIRRYDRGDQWMDDMRTHGERIWSGR